MRLVLMKSLDKGSTSKSGATFHDWWYCHSRVAQQKFSLLHNKKELYSICIPFAKLVQV